LRSRNFTTTLATEVYYPFIRQKLKITYDQNANNIFCRNAEKPQEKRHRSFWNILATVGGVRKWTHRGHLEHGGEGEVALLRVNDEGEGRRGDVSEGAHDGERQHGGRRGHQQRVQVAASVVLQRLPHAAPPIDAREAEDGSVEARRQKVEEAPAARRRKPSLQWHLREAE
jgi:hypothetical protein